MWLNAFWPKFMTKIETIVFFIANFVWVQHCMAVQLPVKTAQCQIALVSKEVNPSGAKVVKMPANSPKQNKNKKKKAPARIHLDYLLASRLKSLTIYGYNHIGQ